MIYTLTVSPSLDYTNYIDDFDKNKINRANISKFILGGKGINVSQVLKTLGEDSIVLGFKAGFTGDYLQNLLNQKNIKNDLIEVEGFTRINVKVISNCETAINTNTLTINNHHLQLLISKIKQVITDGDYLIISGSIPQNISQDYYENIIKELDDNINIVVDAEKELLVNTLKYKPFLIKPNREELEQIFNKKINNLDDAIYCAKILQQQGAKNVIVSLDSDGALLVDQSNNEYFIKNIEGEKVNSVGAGDSLIAGFIYGVNKGLSMRESLLLGVACGNATTFSEGLGNKSSIYQILELLKEIN